jgi:hypothetical protein
MSDWTPPPGTKITQPWINADDPRYKWTTGADVQETWRKQGWVPPSAALPPPPPEKFIEIKPLRRVR